MIGIVSVLWTLAVGIGMWVLVAAQTVRGFKELKHGFKDKYRDARDSGDRLAAATMMLKMITYISIFTGAAAFAVMAILAPWALDDHHYHRALRELFLLTRFPEQVLWAMLAAVGIMTPIAMTLMAISDTLKKRKL